MGADAVFLKKDKNKTWLFAQKSGFGAVCLRNFNSVICSLLTSGGAARVVVVKKEAMDSRRQSYRCASTATIDCASI